MNSEQVEEAEALKAIYGDDFRVISERERTVRVTIKSDDASLSLDLLLIYPEDYPSVSPPIYEIKNAYWISSEGQKHLASKLTTIFDENKGDVVVYQWIEEVREFLNQKASELHIDSLDSDSDSTGLDQDKEASEGSQQELDGSNSVDQKTAEPVAIVCPMIHHGDPLTDRKSTFQAHAAEVHTTGEVQTVLSELKSSKKIATATHNILAYRLHNESSGVFHQDCDDDGETAAGGRLLHLLQIMDGRNVMVVVTRWYGGIRLHADRFKHINNVARILLQETGLGIKHKVLEAAGGGKAKGQSKSLNSSKTKHKK